MRKLKFTRQFERDFKRIKKNPSYSGIDSVLNGVIENLQMDRVLAAKFQDHSLQGDYKNCRECHIRPDLLLVYEKIDKKTLTLIRLGSHSDIF